MSKVTPADIDAILPQTQCGLCGFGGCMPYAEALVHNHAAIDLCPPGGIKGLHAIAKLMNQDPSPFLASMVQKENPKLVARIREIDCIGCTKCIKACPVDAIIGSGKWMHTVIENECTGCELCLVPCPVDCIDMFPIPAITEQEEKVKANHARERFHARQKRLTQQQCQTLSTASSASTVEDKQAYLQAALLRKKNKNRKPDPVP